MTTPTVSVTALNAGAKPQQVVADTSTVTWAVGDEVTYEGHAYVCEIAADCATTKPDDAVNQVKATRVWKMKSKPSPQPSKDKIAAMLADGAPCAAWAPEYIYYIYEFGCGAAGKMYRCLQPKLCSIVDPEGALNPEVDIGDGLKAVWEKREDFALNPSAATVTYRGMTVNMSAVATVEDEPWVRSGADCLTW